MGPLELLNHLLNFLAPAVAVGILLALAGRFFGKKMPAAPGFIAQAAINCVAGALALGVGLVVFGRDGKVASYGLMLAAVATSQWLASRGRR